MALALTALTLADGSPLELGPLSHRGFDFKGPVLPDLWDGFA